MRPYNRLKVSYTAFLSKNVFVHELLLLINRTNHSWYFSPFVEDKSEHIKLFWTGDLIFIFRFCFCTRSRCLYTPPPLYSGNEVCPIVLLPLALEPPFFSFHFVKMMMFLIPLIKLLQYKGNFNSIRWQA